MTARRRVHCDRLYPSLVTMDGVGKHELLAVDRFADSRSRELKICPEVHCPRLTKPRSTHVEGADGRHRKLLDQADHLSEERIGADIEAALQADSMLG